MGRELASDAVAGAFAQVLVCGTAIRSPERWVDLPVTDIAAVIGSSATIVRQHRIKGRKGRRQILGRGR
jgi:hypothetical protein